MSKQKKILTSMRNKKYDALPAYEKKENMSKLKHFLKQVGGEIQVSGGELSEVLANGNTKGNVIVVNNNAGQADAKRMLNAAARFNLKVNRLSANIAAALPVPILGGQAYPSDWVKAMQEYLPIGTTYAVTRMADKKGINIAYTLAGQTDNIQITTTNKPYISLLEGSKVSTMNLTEIKMKLSNADNQDQFTQEFVPYFDSLFGRKGSDSFTPDDFFRDDQEQDSIRTIRQNIEIEPEMTLIIMKNAIADSFTLTSVVEEYTTVRK